jgi:peptidoglycan/LPS O-acetylase OafA/YrhL
VETPGEFGGTPPASAPLPGAAPPGAASPGPASPGPNAAHADAEGPAGKEQEDSGWNRYNATAVIASGVTLALLGTAAFYGAEASSKEGDINRLVTYRFPPTQYSSVAATYTKDMADGKSDAHTSRILLLAAAGTGLVAAVFFVLDAVRTPTEAAPAAPALPAVSVSIAPANGGFGAQGAWSWRF